MTDTRDYMLELSQTPASWAPQFAADCVEHVLPILEKLNLPAERIAELKTAVQAVRAGNATLEELTIAAMNLIAIRKGVREVPYLGSTAAALATIARDFAPSPKEEHEWQERRFYAYKQAMPRLEVGYFDGRQMAAEAALGMLIGELEEIGELKFSERLVILKDFMLANEELPLEFKRGFEDCLVRLSFYRQSRET